MDWLSKFMVALAVLSSSLIYLQVYKVWKRRSHNDISFLLVLFQVINAAFWTIYGVSLGSTPLIVSGGLASLAFLSLLYLKLTIPTIEQNGWKYI